MKIVQGLGTPTGVSLGSHEYVATVRRMRDGTLTSHVRKRGASELWLMRSRWFFPKFLRMFVLIVMSLPVRVQLVFLGMVCGFIGLLLYASPEKVEATMDTYSLLIDTILKGVTFTIVGFTLWRARGHHASEHMTINAYEQFGEKASERIHEASRVHRYCGGRFLFPSLLIGVLGMFLRVNAHPDIALFVSLGLLELMFWVDAFAGLHNIAVTNKASTLLQTYVTTRPPTKDELEVGRTALSALIAVHQKV
jgi:uncharacterized protein YqhQ